MCNPSRFVRGKRPCGLGVETLQTRALINRAKTLSEVTRVVRFLLESWREKQQGKQKTHSFVLQESPVTPVRASPNTAMGSTMTQRQR